MADAGIVQYGLCSLDVAGHAGGIVPIRHFDGAIRPQLRLQLADSAAEAGPSRPDTSSAYNTANPHLGASHAVRNAGNASSSDRHVKRHGFLAAAGATAVDLPRHAQSIGADVTRQDGLVIPLRPFCSFQCFTPASSPRPPHPHIEKRETDHDHENQPGGTECSICSAELDQELMGFVDVFCDLDVLIESQGWITYLQFDQEESQLHFVPATKLLLFPQPHLCDGSKADGVVGLGMIVDGAVVNLLADRVLETLHDVPCGYVVASTANRVADGVRVVDCAGRLDEDSAGLEVKAHPSTYAACFVPSEVVSVDADGPKLLALPACDDR
ncbi:hypothetical protein PG993_006858 [Apiospora rasikravindrae]|uniref:Uncharacterized protein n=1 Tax=Apiospora rasikravindrae TaxID=990691 RepID=A0ABR1SVU4_9PEZI